jgi:integrase
VQGHIRKRQPAGTWEYILDVGVFAAQRCEACGRRFWVERRPKERCPFCGGQLRETEERRRETKAGFVSRKDCQAALTAKLTTMAEQTYVLPSHLSVREFLTRVWLPAIEPGVRPTTLSGYRILVESHLVPQLGSVKLQSLSAAQINAHYARLLAEGRVHGKGGLSPSSVHHVHAALHRALRDAVKWGYLQSNVASFAEPPRASAQHRELAVWSEEQLHAFLDSVRGDRLYPLWRFCAMTGCRRGEALGLTWPDLDVEASAVTIRRALVPIDGELRETEPKTKRGRRRIALDAETVTVLRELAASQLGEQQDAGDEWVASGRVFTKENGEQLHPERISALFRRLVRAAALPPIPLHGLRHTYASIALAKGVNPAIVSRRLGHSTVAFTLDVYSHVLPQVDAEAAELIAEFAASAGQRLTRGDG